MNSLLEDIKKYKCLTRLVHSGSSAPWLVQKSLIVFVKGSFSLRIYINLLQYNNFVYVSIYFILYYSIYRFTQFKFQTYWSVVPQVIFLILKKMLSLCYLWFLWYWSYSNKYIVPLIVTLTYSHTKCYHFICSADPILVSS